MTSVDDGDGEEPVARLGAAERVDVKVAADVEDFVADAEAETEAIDDAVALDVAELVCVNDCAAVALLAVLPVAVAEAEAVAVAV